VVAIIDSGVNYLHEDLRENMWRNPGETSLDQNGKDKASNGIDDDDNGYVDDVHGIDVVDYDSRPMDDGLYPTPWYHDTFIAGQIAAVADNIPVVAADSLYSSSEYGRTTVDLAAPGGNITSTFGPGPKSYLDIPFDATSIATPYVTGAAALLVSLDPMLTVDELKTAILLWLLQAAFTHSASETEGHKCHFINAR